MFEGEVPPPEIQEVIVKTIPLVQEGGSSTAGRLLLSNPQLFGFLDATDKWHAWYQWKATEGQERDREDTDLSSEMAIEPLVYAYDHPGTISIKLLETIKLVAKKKATDPAFNPSSERFRFLAPENIYYNLFQSFLTQYKSVMEKRQVDRIRIEESKNYDAILRRALGRARWLMKHSSSSSEDKHAESVRFSEIDWQKFRVIASVEVLKTDVTSTFIPPLTPENVALSTPASAVQKEPKLKSPYTGELVPASLYEEHIRVHSLDPRWEERKRISEEEEQRSNLVHEEAYSNLQRQAKRKRNV